MDGLTIQIGWEWALGIIGALIAIAWYSSSRFTALETSMDWIKEILRELKITSDNLSAQVFGAHSPVDLKPVGEQWLAETGLKEYVDKNKDDLIQLCQARAGGNPYEVQKRIFQLFDTLAFDSAFDDKLKKFAFEKGTTMGIVRRVGAIYLRNLCLDELGMNREEIDKHDPEKKAQKSN